MSTIEPEHGSVDAGGVSDGSLASRARRGDRAAFGVLVARHGGRVRRFALARLRDGHDADEVAQEAMLRAWGSIRTYREGEAFTPWVMAIARREVVNVIRRRQKDARDRDPHERARETGPDGQRDGAFGEGSVWGLARETLSADAFEAVWLRYVEGMEPGQIARVLGRSGVGVRVMLHRARRALQARLEEDGAGERAGENGRREVRVAAREVLCEQA